jgi:hypothetical protein
LITSDPPPHFDRPVESGETFASSSRRQPVETFELATLDVDTSSISSRPSSLDLEETAQFFTQSYSPHSSRRTFDKMTEKGYKSKLRYWADKLAVESEPSLTNRQLMLTNYDLKPVEPERRQWGAWNFVGFWIGESTS